MAKNKPNISVSYHELSYIKERENQIASVVGAIENAAKFKVGDYLVAYNPAVKGIRSREVITNSYGAPKKFIVVHTDKFGIPYIKELNKNGQSIGNLLSPVKLDRNNYMSSFSDMEFEVDPDYADAIIFEDEEGFDATATQKQKSDMFKAITAHNKSLKVDWRDVPALIAFLKSLKPGDVVWRSIKSNFTILTIKPIPTTHRDTRLSEYDDFGTAQDNKGNIFDLNYGTFKWKAIYKGQPRSYKELKD